jgi:hypothetical protein
MQLKLDKQLRFRNQGLLIDPGGELVSEIEYDNSVANTANPDPRRTVFLGGSTLDDEMHYPRFLYVED